MGTINVVDAARRHRVSRFLNFQTVLCYGRPKTVPIPVEHPLRPFTSYGISKVAGEQYLAMSGLPFASFRLANVTGPRLAIGPIPTFYKRLKSGQGCFCTDAQRDFLDMSDFLAAVDLAMEDDAPTGIFNVSSGEVISILSALRSANPGLQLRRRPSLDQGISSSSISRSAYAVMRNIHCRIGRLTTGNPPTSLLPSMTSSFARTVPRSGHQFTGTSAT